MSSPTAVFNGRRRVPPPVNEPIRAYAPGSPERASLKARLKAMASETIEMPLIIGGQEIRTGITGNAVMPHDHQHVLGTYHKATEQHVQQAIAAAGCAQKEWASWAFEDRAAGDAHVSSDHFRAAGPVLSEALAAVPEIVNVEVADGWSQVSERPTPT